MRTAATTAAFLLLLASGDAHAGEFDVRLFSRTISRPNDAGEVIAELGKPGVTRVRAIVRFEGPLTGAEHKVLRAANIHLLSYLGGHGYVASIPAPLSFRALPGVRGADLFTPRDRLANDLDCALPTPPAPDCAQRPAVTGRAPPEIAVFERGATTRYYIRLVLFEDVGVRQRRDVFALLGTRPVRYGHATWRALVSSQELEALSHRPEVRRIEAEMLPEPEPLNEYSRFATRSDEAQHPFLNLPKPNSWLDGTGVGIAIFDFGIDTTHPDFFEVTDAGAPGNLRVDPTRPPSLHGTHVASIAAGSGLDSAQHYLPDFERRGHAPNAQLGDFTPITTQLGDLITATSTFHVSNHSYVESTNGYNALSADLDRIVRGDAVLGSNPAPRPQVWAAGNNGISGQHSPMDRVGYHSTVTSAKNTISVGAVEAPSRRLLALSSLGPSRDGRIKPDLVAPGCRRTSSGSLGGIKAAHSEVDGYVQLCGTSMAAPAVTGIIALLVQQLTKDGNASGWIPSTFKAALIHTAVDLVAPFDTPCTGQCISDAGLWANPDTSAAVSYHRGPDFATGWGLVDAEAARALAADDARWKEDEVGLGQTDEFCMTVPPGSPEVRATIAWDDTPGAPSLADDAPVLVNDLDLSLHYDPVPVSDSQTGAPSPPVLLPPDDPVSTVLPWTIAWLPESSGVVDWAHVVPAQRGIDRRNNVEMASWPEPPAGRWRIRVLAHAIPLDVPQPYSLAASAAIEGCQP